MTGWGWKWDLAFMLGFILSTQLGIFLGFAIALYQHGYFP